jgi:predicted Zn-dependent protease
MTETIYPCHGVHHSLTKGRASGELTITEAQLSFTVNKQRIMLHFDQLELSLGGAGDRLVFFSHPLQPDWRFYTSDRSVLKDPLLKKYTHLSTTMTRARKKLAYGWAVLALVAVICIVIPAALLMNMDVASKLIAEQVPLEWENELGEISYKQYTLQADIMEKDRAKPLLEPLIDPLLAALPDKRYDYHFYISNNPALNAFALPGGYVVINSGLILAAESAEEVLGVVAHEITHVRERHGIRNVISSAGTYLVISAILGDASGLLGMITDAAPLFITQGYSRKFESEADKLGFNMLVTANINPQGLALFFEKLIAQEKEMLDIVEDKDSRKWLETGMGFLSSHPGTQARVDALNERAKQVNNHYLDLNPEFARLQSAVAEFVTE